jgi:energy-coupling factor transporter ATP-binding protein EcfA2
MNLGWVVAAGMALLAAVLAIPKDLLNRWRSRITDRLDHYLRRRTTRFGQRYRDHLFRSLKFVDLKGLATIGSNTPELDEVFVDVSLAYRPPHQVQGSVLSQVPPEVTDRHSIDDFLSRDQPSTLAVLGAPGSGKTTLLRHTAREICRHQKKHKRRVPVLLYLRDHVTIIVDSPTVTLPDLIRTTLGGFAADEPPDWFEQQLRDGNCVILLDGLDEVAREEFRRKMSNWVERQVKEYPRNDFVITSRPLGYQSATIAGAVVLQVRSFTEEQITQFVHSWYLAVERHSTGAFNDEVRVRAETASTDLLTRLKDAPALDDLTVNPLLLTMIANVHRHRGALPGSRSDLYGEICQVMLWRRAEAKDIPLRLSGDKKESLLRGLAYTMMQRRVRDLPRTDILDELKTALSRVSTEMTAEDFLTDTTTNGLLLERESGVFSFAHLTFQEYLASAYIRDKGCVRVLVAAVDDIWWRETTLLYSAKSDADPIVQACLRSGSVNALLLAFDCADQANELAFELREELERILDTDETDPARARARVKLLVARHLRQVVRTTSGGRVCARPISRSIYDLFVTDLPEHQLWPSSSVGDPPATGVPGPTVAAFVEWANRVTGGEPGYRLPHDSEVSDQSVRRSLEKTGELSFWTANGRRREPELWTPPGVEHPHLLSRATLLHHVAADLTGTPGLINKIRLIRAKVIVTALQWAFRRGEPILTDLADYRDSLDSHLARNTAMDGALCFTDPYRYERHMVNTIRRKMSPLQADCLRAATMAILQPVPKYSNAFVGDPITPILNHLELIIVRSRAHGADRRGDPDAVVDEACARMMGRGLARSLARSGNMTSMISMERLADALLTEAGLDEPHVIVSPDVVMPGIYRHEQWDHWANDVALQLDETMRHLGSQWFTPRWRAAARLRLPALCIAGEVPPDAQIEPSPLREWMREMPAGVTLLERRANGQTRPTEAIMLATT